MNLVILTGNSLRHNYFVNTIAQAMPVAAVFREAKVSDPANSVDTPAGNSEEAELREWHFGLARREEVNFFGQHREIIAVDCNFFDIPGSFINEPEWMDKIRRCRPDYIAVFGTSLLKRPIIDIVPGRIFNMHLGLSPYYRGSATNFWPLRNNEPEYVGVTIHLIDLGIDSGAIAHQGRPEIVLGDNQHTIGNKTIIVGTNLMVRTLQEARAGTLALREQEGKGRLYQRRDFSVENIAELKNLVEDDLIAKYLERRARVWPAVKLVD